LRNLVAAHDFYDVRRTFYVSTYENLVEKSVRHASGVKLDGFFVNSAHQLRCVLCLLESRAKKSRNWEEADFYDSDEDTFLDRTGDIEKKRQKRILRVKPAEKKTENYESLVSM